MNPASDPGHGHSPAAWTAVVVMTLALSVGTVAFFFQIWWLVIASAVATLGGLGFRFSLGRYGVGRSRSEIPTEGSRVGASGPLRRCPRGRSRGRLESPSPS
jgi:hypothetical protein